MIHGPSALMRQKTKFDTEDVGTTTTLEFQTKLHAHESAWQFRPESPTAPPIYAKMDRRNPSNVPSIKGSERSCPLNATWPHLAPLSRHLPVLIPPPRRSGQNENVAQQQLGRGGFGR